MPDFSVSELVNRHRLSLAQVDRLGWAEVAKEDLLQEKIQALAKGHQIQKILDQLEETGIPFICIKGFALSQRLYQDGTLRYANDIDILIPTREDVVVLRQKLLKKGWLPEADFWVEDQPRRDWYMELAMHCRLIDQEKQCILEIHWNLDWLLLNLSEIELKTLLETNTEKIVVFQREIHVLSPELELVYLLVHGARHAWFRLKWLVDIHDYPISILNNDKFEYLIHRFKVTDILNQASALLKFYFEKDYDLLITGKVRIYNLDYCKFKIMETEKEKDEIGFWEFFNNVKYFWHLTGNRNVTFKMLKRTIGVRPQDISQVNFDAFWKYAIYRYLSILKRKKILFR